MIVILPLSNDEKVIFKNNDERIKIYELRSNDCEKPFDHIFFAEIGKLIYFKRNYLKYIDKNETIAFIQNRRYFNDIENIKIENDNDVVVARNELFFFNIFDQFLSCYGHRNFVKMFNEIIEENNFTKILKNSNNFNPHNIFISKVTFFNSYVTFLEETLLKYFNESFSSKGGAWISERLLYAYLIKNNYNLIEKDIIVIKK